MRYLLFTTLLLLVSGCLTDKKLAKHADMYYATHPEIFAGKCADLFDSKIMPGSVLHKSDTIILQGITIPCPDQLQINPVTGKTDTIPGKKVHCPDSRIIYDTLTQHDTIENKARIVQLQYDTAAKGDRIRQLTATLLKAEKRAKNRLYLSIALIIAIAAGLYLSLRK